MTHVFEFDVFLSHSIKDKDTVRDLADRLQKDGLRVWLDEWEIQPGDSVPFAIERGLESSRTLILVMSEHSVGRSSPSEWVTFERHASLFRDPTNQKRRFIPVRIDDVSVSDALGQFAYVDWRRKDESQYAKLLTLCRRQRSGDVCGSPDIATFDIRSISDEDNDPRSKYIALMRLRCGRYERSFQGSPMNEVTASTHVIQWLGERTTADRTGAQEVRQRKKHDDIRLEERHTFRDILKRRGKIVVIGRAGRGKTSLLYWAALRALDALEVSPEARVPIYVPLKELAQTRSVEDFRVYLTHKIAAPTVSEWLWNHVSTGNVLLLLDGLDEVPRVGVSGYANRLELLSNQGIVAELVRMLEPARAQVVLTCRDSAYAEHPIVERLSEMKRRGGQEGFAKWELKAFDASQVAAYACSFFQHNEASLELFLKSIELRATCPVDAQSPSRYVHLAQEPLYLHMLCWLWATHDATRGHQVSAHAGFQLPTSEDDLWGETVARLLGQRDVSREEARDSLRLLEEVAFHARVCRKPLTRSFVEETMGWMANSTGRILPTVGTAKWLSDLQQWDLLVEQRLDGGQLYNFSIPGLDEYFAARHMAHRWIEGDAAYRSWLPSRRGWWWRHGRIRCPNPFCRQQLPLFRETLQWVEHKNAALMMVGMLRQSQAEELLLQGVPDVSLQLMCLSRCRSAHAEVSSRLRQLLHRKRLGRLILRLTLWLTAPVWVPVILIYFLALRTGEGLALLMLAGLAGAVFVTGKILSLMDISSLWARVPLFVVLSLVLWVFGVVLVALLPELLWWGGLTAIRNLRKSLHSLAPWLTGLSERACPTKQPTQEALRAIGSARLPVNRDAVIDVYLSATSSRSAAIRSFAVETLGGIGHSRGTDAIIASLRDRAGFVRGRGVQALVELDDERAFEAMKTFLGSRGMPEYDQDLSEELARAIRGKQDSRAIPALIVALNGDSGGLWVIRDALKEFGEYAVPALCEVLHKPDSAAAQQAVKVLVEIGKPAEEPLTAMLTSANWRLRKVAAESLGRLRVPTAIEPLLSRLNDAHPDVGVAAAQALGRIGNNRAVTGLQNALESGGSSLAAAAVGALFAIKGPEVVLELEIQKTAVREATIAAVVTKIDGDPLRPVVASLTNLGEVIQERIFAAMRPLVCSTIETQMKQSHVAWDLSSEEFPESAVPLASGALESLVDALREDSVEVRRGMVSVIVAAGRIERWNGDVRRFLRRALVDPDIRTRAAILLCLKRLNRLWALWLYLCKDRKKVLSEIEHLESC
jgi:HEAT repeat protein